MVRDDEWRLGEMARYLIGLGERRQARLDSAMQLSPTTSAQEPPIEPEANREQGCEDTSQGIVS